MPFESLSERLGMALRRLTGRGRINENDIDEMMKEVRVSLLEADVNYRVVKAFIKDVKEKALGERVMKSLTPGDQVLKIVDEELKMLMGEEATPINMNPNGTTVILLAGLQGSGKTTHAGKLAAYLRKTYNVRPLLIAADIYRPAAVNQLVTLGKQLDVEVFQMGIFAKPQAIVKKGLEYAKENGFNLVLIDTAGRLHNKENLVRELQKIDRICREKASPDCYKRVLVIDATTGQNALRQAEVFNEAVGIDAIVLTKYDSTAKGGVAISIGKAHGVNKSIKTPVIQYGVIENVHKALPELPLVAHGSSTVPAKWVELIIKYGGEIKKSQGISEIDIKKMSKSAI